MLEIKRKELESKKQPARAYTYKRAFDSILLLSPKELEERIQNNKLETIEGFTVKVSEYIEQILKNYKFYTAAHEQITNKVQKNTLDDFVTLDTTEINTIIEIVSKNVNSRYKISSSINYRELMLELHNARLRMELNISIDNFLLTPLLKR